MAAGFISLRTIHAESNGSPSPVLWENSGGPHAATNTNETFTFDTSLHPQSPALPFHCASFSSPQTFHCANSTDPLKAPFHLLFNMVQGSSSLHCWCGKG